MRVAMHLFNDFGCVVRGYPITHSILKISWKGLQWASRNASEQTDPRKAHQTTISSWKGFRMNPSNTSESVCWWFNEVLCLKSRFNSKWMKQWVHHNNHLSNQSTSILLHPCRYIRIHIASQQGPSQSRPLPSHRAASFVHHIRIYSL